MTFDCAAASCKNLKYTHAMMKAREHCIGFCVLIGSLVLFLLFAVEEEPETENGADGANGKADEASEAPVVFMDLSIEGAIMGRITIDLVSVTIAT